MKRATSTGQILIAVRKRTDVPLRAQIESALRDAIRSGRLRAGASLPSTRLLAEDLGISRGVIVEAYEQLLAEGYLTARRGSGTVVTARLTHVPASTRKEKSPESFEFDFRSGVPDLRLFPQRAWLSALRAGLKQAGAKALDYPDERGPESVREVLASYLNRARATAVNPDQVLLCNGAAQATALLTRVFQRIGMDRVAVESPGYADQCTDLRAQGIATIPVPVDAEGIQVRALRKLKVGAVFVTPAHQYPMGSVMSGPRRAELLEWASRTKSFIVEDDYDAEYRYDREPVGAMHGLAPHRVIYVGTMSKTVAPALRIGWLLLPDSLVDKVRQAKLEADRGSSVVEQFALAAFISSGEMDRHIRRTRAIYRRRRDALVAALKRFLPQGEVRGVSAGLHLLVELESGTDESYIVGKAARKGIRVTGLSSFAIGSLVACPPGLILGYGALPEQRIPLAVKRLSEALNM
jgi:GntR family transcriptional regulator / MocR family aminotransferase